MKMQSREQIRLSGLLQAQGPDGSSTAEATYWASAEVQSFLQKLDGYALLVVLANNAGLLLYASTGSKPFLGDAAAAAGSTADVRWGILLSLILAAVQYMLLLQRADVCRTHRHSLAVGNRLLRLGFQFGAALQQSFNVMGQKFLQENSSLHAVLARRLAFGPLVQLQISFHFGLPVQTAVLLQPLSVPGAAAMGYNAPRMLLAVPGMQALTGQVCSRVSAWHDVVLFVLTLGVSPQPGMDSCCRGPAVFGQLLVFTNLLCSFWLPLFAAHIVELHAKLSYWRARGMDVVVAPSLLLPMPEHRLLSHVLVGLLAPTLLWSLAELLAPVLAARV